MLVILTIITYGLNFDNKDFESCGNRLDTIKRSIFECHFDTDMAKRRGTFYHNSISRYKVFMHLCPIV